MFHSDDYVSFLRNVTPDTLSAYESVLSDCLLLLSSSSRADTVVVTLLCVFFLCAVNVGEDCPVFRGLFDFCQISAGGSVAGAMKLNSGECDVAINWAGGLHHAKKGEASGFCYVNDIVLGILELLKVHERVLYIDIDIHHGDGVEEAFYTSPRVMTFSLHKYGDFFFPGTGGVNDTGSGLGVNHAVNFPLKNGIDDAMYESIFKPVINAIMENYRPGAVLIQCGADSLAGDRLGSFNLTLNGHGRCVQHVLSFRLPTLVVGGGGYTPRNVARCWTNETAICVGTPISNNLPYTDDLEYFSPDFYLQIAPSAVLDNQNTQEYVDKIRSTLIQNIRHAAGTPQLSMHKPVPHSPATLARLGIAGKVDVEAEENPELHSSQMQRDKRVVREDEFMDDEEDKFTLSHHLPHRVLLTVDELAKATDSSLPAPKWERPKMSKIPHPMKPDDDFAGMAASTKPEAAASLPLPVSIPAPVPVSIPVSIPAPSPVQPSSAAVPPPDSLPKPSSEPSGTQAVPMDISDSLPSAQPLPSLPSLPITPE